MRYKNSVLTIIIAVIMVPNERPTCTANLRHQFVVGDLYTKAQSSAISSVSAETILEQGNAGKLCGIDFCTLVSYDYAH